MASPTRWGIISAGLISSDFVASLKALPADEHRVVAVAARSLQSAKAFAARHGIEKSYGSYSELAADPNIGNGTFELLNIISYYTNSVSCQKNSKKNIIHAPVWCPRWIAIFYRGNFGRCCVCGYCANQTPGGGVTNAAEWQTCAVRETLVHECKGDSEAAGRGT